MRTVLTSLAIALSSLFLFSDHSLLAQDCTRYEDYIHLMSRVSPGTGSARGVAVQGTNAYLALWTAGLQSVDVSDPFHSTLISRLPMTWPARKVRVSGNVAYVCTSEGLDLVDVSDPAAMIDLGMPLYVKPAEDAVIRGDYAYVVCGSNGLKVVRVSDPAHPVWVGTWLTLPSYARTITMSSVDPDLAFIGHGRAFSVVSLTNPLAPALLGTVLTPADITDIEIRGQYAYAAMGLAGIQVINIANPSAPIPVVTVDTPGFASTLDRSGSTLFISAGFAPSGPGDAGLQVYDLANPALPVLRGVQPITEGWEVIVQGSFAYVANRNDLSIIAVRNPSFAPTLGSVMAGSRNPSTELAVVGNIAYASLRVTPQFGVFDFTYPSTPQVASLVAFPDSSDGSGAAIGANGTLVCLATRGGFLHLNEGWLHLIDTTVPSAPAVLSRFHLASFGLGIALSAERAFVAQANGLAAIVVDVSDPAAPESTGTFGVVADGIRVAGQYAYILPTGSTGIQIFDITSPDVPGSVGRVMGASPSHHPLDLTVMADHAYVTGSVGTDVGFLEVMDVSTPSAPDLVGSTELPHPGLRVAVNGDVAYVLTTETVELVSLSSLSAPQYVAECYTANPFPIVAGARGLAIAGSSLLACLDAANGATDARNLECTLMTSVPGSRTSAAGGLGLAISPNPGAGGTTLRFALETECRVTLDIIDVSGRRVRRLVDGALSAGAWGFMWDGRDDDGRPVASGAYFSRLSWTGGAETARLILLR